MQKQIEEVRKEYLELKEENEDLKHDSQNKHLLIETLSLIHI